MDRNLSVLYRRENFRRNISTIKWNKKVKKEYLRKMEVSISVYALKVNALRIFDFNSRDLFKLALSNYSKFLFNFTWKNLSRN